MVYAELWAKEWLKAKASSGTAIEADVVELIQKVAERTRDECVEAVSLVCNRMEKDAIRTACWEAKEVSEKTLENWESWKRFLQVCRGEE